MSTPINQNFVKCRITQLLGRAEFIGIDLLDGSERKLKMTGKQRMNYIKVAIGDEVYGKYEPLFEAYRFLTMSNFKYEDTLYKEKIQLDKILRNKNNK